MKIKNNSVEFSIQDIRWDSPIKHQGVYENTSNIVNWLDTNCITLDCCDTRYSFPINRSEKEYYIDCDTIYYLTDQIHEIIKDLTEYAISYDKFHGILSITFETTEPSIITDITVLLNMTL